MKAFLILVTFLIAAVSAQADSCTNCETNDHYGNCKILYPRYNDKAGYSCSNGNFGVLYNGYFSTNKCYSTIAAALTAMREDPACEQYDRVGNCKILYPRYNDKAGYSCSNGNFGVLYNGYFASNKCYTTAAAALSAMRSLGL